MKKKLLHSSALMEEAETMLYQAMLSLKTVKEAKQFFEDLCTPSERQAMVDRWRIIDAIVQRVPYRTIAQQTKVSVTTIGRVARCLEQGSGGYRLVYERLKQSSGSR